MGSRVLAQRYELTEKIGEGGMAVVFKAYDRVLGRYVALKILRPEYTKDENFVESFRRESQLVAGIGAPNIVQVFDVGQEGDIHYMVMELVDGKTLSEIIRENGRLSPETVVSYGKQIANALSVAHSNHLIHRDIKPHNIMVTVDGVAKLTDFGIAKRNNPGNTIVADEKEAVMGSIHYFSPEQARGNKVDERSDIYSLGIVMYEMLTGEVPYDGENAVEVAVKHMNEPMTPPSRKVEGVPEDLERIILKATAKHADDRYSSAQEMITELSFVRMSRLSPYYKDKDDDAGMIIIDRQPRRFERAIAAALIILLIPLLGSAYDAISASIKESRRLVTVPNLRGYTLEEATELLKKMELEIVVASRVKSTDEYPDPDIITNQSPDAETQVKPGQSVKVNVTQAEPDPVVPGVGNMQLSAAKTKLESIGFVIGEVREEYSSVVKEQMVISTDPAIGSSAPKGTTVNIIVSKGEDPEGKTSFKLDVRGLTLEEAKKRIQDHGCWVSDTIIDSVSGDAEPGCVVDQYPKADDEVESGTTFTLTVKIQDVQNSVVLTVDLSSIADNTYSLSIVVEDAEGSSTQVEKATYRKSSDSATFIVRGKGTGKAYVTLNNDMITYSINFSTGSVTVE